MTSALELSNTSKQFGATRALDGVDLTVANGEVHALLGENGSGKSTLIKVLAGVHAPEPGAGLVVGGTNVELPMAAGTYHEIGLSFVHQDLGLARALTVLENLVGSASRADHSRFRIDWRSEATKARAMLKSYGVDVDPRVLVDELPPVGQALVAIARAAEELREYRERTGSTTSVLVLDEPTVFLPEEELEFLFDLIRQVVDGGSSVIFISHDLAAVREIADSFTVLRDGKRVAGGSMNDVTDDQVIEFIVGPSKARELNEHGGQFHLDRAITSFGDENVRIEGLVGDALNELNLTVGRGEIVGLAGLLGSGAEEVPYLLFGAQPAKAGKLTIDGSAVDVTSQQPASAVGMGLAFIPADRNRDAIAREVEIDRNMMSLVLDRFTAGGRLRNGRVRAAAAERSEDFDVRPRRTDLAVGTLSGGNAQKVVLAKWLEIDPGVLLLHEPTQGVDVAARALIYRKIVEAADQGMSVIWVSSDFEELASTCSRVVVLNNGKVTSQMQADELTPEAITARVFMGQQDNETASSASTAQKATQ